MAFGDCLRRLRRRATTPTVDRDRSVTLHEEISDILRSNGNRWMTTTEIAVLVARRGRYVKRDGTSDVSAYQVHGRTRNYSRLFERDGTRVRLRS